MRWYSRVAPYLHGLASVSMIVASGAVAWMAFAVRPSARPPIDASPKAVDQVRFDGAFDLNRVATRGSPRAAVAILEFSDFECPYSGRYARDTLPSVERQFIASGRLRYFFAHYPIRSSRPFAAKPAESAECARKWGREWDMHRMLFLNQSALTHQSLVGYAHALGLDRAAFSQCVEGGETRGRLLSQLELASQLGVDSTPTFFLGEVSPSGHARFSLRVKGAQPFTVFETAVTQLLGDARDNR